MEETKSKLVANFEIFYTQFLDIQGQATQMLPDFAHNIDFLIDLYKAMLRTRIFDAKAISLQRTGKMGTYPSTLGEEAIGVGMGAAMESSDVFCPYYRELGAQLWRGVRMVEVLLYWGGHERGSDFQNKTVKEDFPINVPIASQTLHAVGVAMAMKLKKQKRVAVTSVGDGGTSRGDFYEAMNLAGSLKLPVVFVINNNQWAISMPRCLQTAAKTLAQKGIAAGIPCEQVDGNDIIAVYNGVKNAIERARKGEGPSVIEAITYRMHDHTTADDAKRYRNLEEVANHRLEDPILRLNQYLTSIQTWDEEKEKKLQQQLTDEVSNAVTEYLNEPPPTIESLFDYLYAKLPAALISQREEALCLK